ncbi:hypothetical protein FOA43_003967 [Brettanomyces nanus]|uniref:TATA-binding protein interacting (TIP20) domain-containing protein n=1 Tax=Eeniella nana TaxID=13502 RepID=A0A875S5J2_EENNA|nr:uncharacterized protein FOA43_003967 [Brettanomyces nanus]QPG76576.1 hypothetical protein FOA43_003967 [Brettanomyces nanus]
MRYYLEELFTQTRDTDPDLRFMALTDLEKELINPESKFTPEAKIAYADTLLRCLDDEYSEVRGQALKCFEKLTSRLDNYVANVLKTLSSKKPEKISITSSIYTMAVHNILKNLSPDESTAREIIKCLLGDLLQDQHSFSTIIDYIEVLTDLLEFLGKYFNQSQLSEVADALLKSIFYGDAIIAKKSVTALALLSRYISSVALMKEIINSAEAYYQERQTYKNRQTLLSLFSSLMKLNPSVLSDLFPEVERIILESLKLETLILSDDDFDLQQEIDETRSEAIVCLTVAFDNLPTAVMDLHVEDALQLCAKFIIYDPYAENDDEENTGGDDASEGDVSEYYSEDDEWGEEDDEDKDGTGISWKLRQRASVLVCTLLERLPTRLPLIYKYTFIELINRLQDSNSNVATGMLEAAIKLFKYSREDGPYYSLKSVSIIKDHAEGRRGSDVSMQTEDNPISVLVSKSSWICEQFSKLIVPSNVAKITLFYNFVSELSNASSGLEDSWVHYFVLHFDELREGFPTSETVKFYSSLLSTNGLQTLGNGTSTVIKNIISCLDSSNHELIMETLLLTTDILSKYIPRDSPSDETLSLLAEALDDLLISKSCNKNFSTEIRRESLKALSYLVLHVPLSKEKMEKSLKVFADTITLEFLVTTDMDCIKMLVSDSQVANSISSRWVNRLLRPLIDYTSNSELCLDALEALYAVVSTKVVNDEDKRELLGTLSLLCSSHKLPTNNSITLAKIITEIFETTECTCPDILVKDLIAFSKDPEFENDVLADLVKSILRHVDSQKLIDAVTQTGKQNESGISKLLAMILLAAGHLESIDKVLQDLKTGKNVLFSLVLLEQVSKSIDLNCGVVLFFNYFSSSDEDVANAAVRTAAEVISSKREKYMPELLQSLTSESSVSETQLLQCLSLVLDKIELTSDDSHRLLAVVVSVKESSLQEKLETQDIMPAAECIAKLVLNDEGIVEELCSILSEDHSMLLKASVSSAMKYLLGHDAFLADDVYLLSKYLEASSTEDFLFGFELSMKQIGVTNLIIAVHKRPSVALFLVSKLLPRILEDELSQKKEYVKIVRIGPFKHKIDDALGFRKEIYELIYSSLTALETNPDMMVLFSVDWILLLKTIVTKAFKDDPTIIFLCLLTVLKIINLRTDIFLGNDLLLHFIHVCNKKLNKQLRDEAPKQEIDKRNDTVKAILRCCKKIDLLVKKGTVKLNGDVLVEWRSFIAKIRVKYPIFDTEE